jgi:hypothetical protein
VHLIIDADPIVYRAGYAAESITYQAVFQDINTGSVGERYFTPSDGETAYAKMKAFQAEHADVELLDSEKLVNVEPVSHALMIVKQSIEGILQETGYNASKNGKALTLLLSGPGNYRERIATYKPYKGNRDPEHKPVHYQAIRDYLTDKWKAVVVHGHEADDEASILAAGLRNKRKAYIVASIDKDLHQIPGVHYDYRVKQLVTITPEYARAMLWKQALSGDATDNIPGACKIGAVKAQKLVEEWLEGEDGFSDAMMWHAVVTLYKYQAKTKGCYYCEEDAEKAALENMRLVYLQREPNELWVPPGAEPEYVEASIDD